MTNVTGTTNVNTNNYVVTDNYQNNGETTGNNTDPNLLITKKDGTGDTKGSLDDLPFPRGSNIADLTYILALLHEISTDLRKAMKDARQASREAEEASIMAQAKEIKQAGTLALASGIVSGTMQIAGGLASVGGAIKAGSAAAGKGANPVKSGETFQSAKNNLTGSNQGNQAKLDGANAKLDGLQSKLDAAKAKLGDANANKTATEASANYKDYATKFKEVKDAKVEQTKASETASETKGKLADLDNTANMKYADMLVAKAQGWSQIAMGLGNMGSAIANYFQSEAQAKQKELEAEQTTHRYVTQDADELIKNLQDSLAEIRSKMSEIMNAENQIASRMFQV